MKDYKLKGQFGLEGHCDKGGYLTFIGSKRHCECNEAISSCADLKITTQRSQ